MKYKYTVRQARINAIKNGLWKLGESLPNINKILFEDELEFLQELKTPKDFPSYHKRYYSITDPGVVIERVWIGDQYDIFRKKMGWVFKTELEATEKLASLLKK